MPADTIFKLFEIINRHFQSAEDSYQLVSEIEKLVSKKQKRKQSSKLPKKI